jgi:hypothetical protein
MVVLASLCAVANEFICNQWERKVINTDVYLTLWIVQYGTTGICPLYCCKDLRGFLEL